MKIYLCGQINGATDEQAKGWRDWFKKQLPGDEFFDPMDRDYRGKESEHYREIVELDKLDIQYAELVVSVVRHPSIGTSMELLHAWNCGVPSIVVFTGTSVSPWLRYHSTRIVQTRQQALEVIKEWF
jgi:hypothetical protein